MSGRARVVVVGGGLAGIAAALELAPRAAVTLLEVRPRLGGAAYSFERDGLRLDNGQHVFLRCCTAYRALLDRLGATDRTTLQDRLVIPVRAPGRRPARLRRSRLPAPAHLAGTLARYPYIGLGARAAAARAMVALQKIDPDDPAADRRSLGDWLASQHQGEDAVAALWRLIALPTLNLEPRDASLAQAAQVFQTGLLRRRDAGDIGYARVPLSDLHDGPARGALERAGVAVRLRGRAESIEQRDGGGYTITAAGEVFEADAVVVATPPGRAAALLPAGALREPTALERLGASPIVNLHIHYDRRILDDPFCAGVGTPVQFAFDRTASSGAGDGQLVAISLSAADEEARLDEEALRARYLPAMQALFPAARDATVDRFIVTREHHATFRAAPGARALRPGPRTRLPGLVLAGAWTDTGWPATMEGAVRSGHAAATAILEGSLTATPAPALMQEVSA